MDGVFCIYNLRENKVKSKTTVGPYNCLTSDQHLTFVSLFVSANQSVHCSYSTEKPNDTVAIDAIKYISKGIWTLIILCLHIHYEYMHPRTRSITCVSASFYSINHRLDVKDGHRLPVLNVKPPRNDFT